MQLASDRPLRFPGLTSDEVAEQRRKFGSNILTPPAREPWWKLYLSKYEDPVIRILMIAALIALSVGVFEGHYAEGLGILVAIILATTLAFLNEFQANRAFDVLLKRGDDDEVEVVRNGQFTKVPRGDLVVGDVVLVRQGKECPTDGEVLEGVSLQVNEARLTGESLPVTKRHLAPGESADKGNRVYAENQLLRGCLVVEGHGVMQVTAVGDQTDLGRNALAAAELTGDPTPLNQQLERLSKWIGVVGFGVAGLLFVALVVRGALAHELELTAGQWYAACLIFAGALVALVPVWLPTVYDALELTGRAAKPPRWLEEANWRCWLAGFAVGGVLWGAGTGLGSAAGWLGGWPWLPGEAVEQFLAFFMVAVTIIVVAVPEGLAMSVTLSLAYSMRKMMATNNLVRRMHACETIGAATVICSDKTGTLTLNEMRTHAAHFPAMAKSGAAGAGTAAALIHEGIAANSTANLHFEPDHPPHPLGNPTEGALLLWLFDQGADYLQLRGAFAIEHQWTFRTDRKYMATLGRSAVVARRIVHVKGAPEILLGRSTEILTAEGVRPLDGHRAEIERQLLDYQRRGMRTLGLAYRELPADAPAGELNEVACELVWLGFVAIEDPVRTEVPPAIRACRDAGIQVKIVTGDNPQTAREIARQVGLWDGHETEQASLTGVEFAELDDAAATARARELKILSRARPNDKKRLVQLLQGQGEVVAVTGDGMNDAGALNYAKVGLAMGSGDDIAKEASDIILLDDSFRSIVNAVMWGRSLYENIQRFILFQLTINVAALGIAFLGPFIGVALPLTVTQMLWVNLIMDTFAALALATEPPHGSVMQRQPRRSGAFIVTRPMAWGIFGVAGVFLALLIGVLILFQQADLASGFRLTWGGKPELTMYEESVFFSFFVLLQFWNLFNARCLARSHSAFAGLGANRAFLLIAAAILVGQIAIVQWGGTVFRTAPLSLIDWLVILGVTSLVLWAGETLRALRRLGKHA